MNQKLLWEQAFSCEDNPNTISQLKTHFTEYLIQETSLFEASSGCLSTVDRCVPNIAPLIEDLYRLQPPDVDAGGLPSAPLMQKLSVAKSIYRRRQCGGANDTLWVRQRWPELQSLQVSNLMPYQRRETLAAIYKMYFLNQRYQMSSNLSSRQKICYSYC